MKKSAVFATVALATTLLIPTAAADESSSRSTTALDAVSRATGTESIKQKIEDMNCQFVLYSEYVNQDKEIPAKFYQKCGKAVQEHFIQNGRDEVIDFYNTYGVIPE